MTPHPPAILLVAWYPAVLTIDLAARAGTGTARARADASVLDALSRLGPVATAVTAMSALLIGVLTVVQRARADRRDQWWKRAQCAFDLAASEDPETAARGYAALCCLATSTLTGADEQDLLRSVWEIESLIPKNSEWRESAATEGEQNHDDAAEHEPPSR